ncbi:hypothetical protein ALCH109712_07660 [Alkalicoccus chagannorensis]
MAFFWCGAVTRGAGSDAARRWAVARRERAVTGGGKAVTPALGGHSEGSSGRSVSLARSLSATQRRFGPGRRRPLQTVSHPSPFRFTAAGAAAEKRWMVGWRFFVVAFFWCGAVTRGADSDAARRWAVARRERAVTGGGKAVTPALGGHSERSSGRSVSRNGHSAPRSGASVQAGAVHSGSR